MKPIGTLLLITTLILGMITGSLTTLHLMPDTQQYNITNTNNNKEIIKHNRTINNTITYRKTVEKPVYNNIQPAYADIEYELQGDQLTIDNIDTCGTGYGSSMQPAMYTGYTICSTEYTDQELREGMIIRYKRGEDLSTIHRIQGNYMHEGYVKTTGDNLQTSEHVDKENITHIAKAVIHTKPE